MVDDFDFEAFTVDSGNLDFKWLQVKNRAWFGVK